MKKILFLVLVVSVALGMVACASNPGTAPVITVTMPDFPEGDDAYAPDPDKANDPLVLGLKSSAPIANWKITINLQRQGQGGGPAATPAAAPSGDAAATDQPQRQRRAFFEYEGKKMPGKWQWNYKGSPRAEGQDGRMVTSLQTYRFEITATDKWGNVGTAEGTIPIGVIITKDAEGNYRMAVPAIIFPPNDSDLSKVSEDDQRSNRRVLRLVARVLNKYDYPVTVEGHANPEYADGTPEREKEETTELVPLSEKRAQAVAAYLSANDSVSADRLKALGIGGQRTLFAWDDSENNWQNRRVEFILHK